MLTLNQEEIPTPFSGMFFRDKEAWIELSPELIGPNCSVVELKVIAVAENKMPSEVAFKRYELKADIQPKQPLAEDGQGIREANMMEFIQRNKSVDVLLSGGEGSVFNSGGFNNVEESPDPDNLFGTP